MTNLQENTVEKLSGVTTSPFFTAVLDCLLDRPRSTTPAFEQIMVVDGSFLGQQVGHIGFNDHLGSSDDLRRNLRGIAGAAGLTEDETAWLLTKA